MIDLNEIDLRYGTQEVMKRFHLHMDRGEVTLLRWPSGSGKTSLLKMIMGLQHPSAGTISIDGLEMNRKNRYAIRTKIGYVSQDADLPEGTVQNLIDLTFQLKANRHLVPKVHRIEQAFSRYKLPNSVLQKNIRDLSGGERQRIGFILCQLLQRDIWLLDEVTAGLDRDLKELVVEDVLNSHATCIVVSHDPIWQQADIQEVTI